MHRIDTTNAVPNLFGAGKPGFGSGNPATNEPATFLDADFFNAIQEELAGIVEEKFALNKSDRGQVLKALKSIFLSNDQIVDRTGLTETLLLDRFDVIHKYRTDLAIMGAGRQPTLNLTTGLVQGGVYRLLLNSSGSGALRDLVMNLRPNNTSYSGQFQTKAHVTDGSAANPTAATYTGASFQFDAYGGALGSDGVAELIVYPCTFGQFKKILGRLGDSAGFGAGISIWQNITTPWSTMGLLTPYVEIISPSASYLIEVSIQRIA